MPAGRHSDSTPASRRVRPCGHDYRAVSTVQEALQTATAVVCSRELVVVGTDALVCFS